MGLTLACRDLDLIQPAEALRRVALAWVSVIPPALGFTALAVLLSVTSRSSVVGVGIPVIVGLVMQLAALLHGPELVRRLMITSAFGAWHGLLAEPPYYRPVLHGAAVSAASFVVCLVIAYRALRQRDIAG
jgi:ABC-2 type transport system permease protein